MTRTIGHKIRSFVKNHDRKASQKREHLKRWIWTDTARHIAQHCIYHRHCIVIVKLEFEVFGHTIAYYNRGYGVLGFDPTPAVIYFPPEFLV